MKIFATLIITIITIKSSHQWCRSTVGFTTCGNENLQKDKPLQITGYKRLLEFESGTIEEIPSGTFKFLPELNVLHISNNHVKNLQKGAFDGLQNLQKLTLYNNDIRTIVGGVFRDCKNLKQLDLGQNKLTDILTDGFTGLNHLEELNLGFNDFEIVPAAVNKIKSLTHLKFNNNRLTSLSDSHFNNLNKLEVLDLSDNRINVIRGVAFSGLGQLKELNLKSNYLDALDARVILSDLRALTVVKLAVNSFTCRDLNGIVGVFKRRGVEVAQGFSKSVDKVDGMGCKKV